MEWMAAMSKSKEYDRLVEFMADKFDEIEVEKGDGEHADFVLCRLATTPLIEPDNLVATCSKCFRMVQFRPHAPKKPPRICDECAAPEMAARAKKGELEMIITENTAKDLLSILAKKERH